MNEDLQMQIAPTKLTNEQIEAELSSLTGTGWETEARRWRLSAELKFRKETSDEQSSRQHHHG
jgi:hypothetical protein